MNKKFCLLIGAVFIVWSGVCVLGQDKDPNAAEVLRHYKESLSWIQSLSMEIDVETHTSDSKPDREIVPYKTNFVFRRDHDRTEWIGELLTLDQNGVVDTSKSFVLNDVMTGEHYGSVIGIVNELPDVAMITSDYEERQKKLLDSPDRAGALFGKMQGSSHKGVAELLAGAATLRLRDGQENVNGVSCYVLEAMTDYGKVTAWLAPEKGYSALKWSIDKRKDRDDLLNESPISQTSWLAVFAAVELQKVGDVFVTTAGTLTHTINFADGRTIVFRHKYKVSEVELTPDFGALGAFVFNLPDGTPVNVEEYPGIRYIWKNGQIVPADDPTFEEIDKTVEELKKEQQ